MLLSCVMTWPQSVQSSLQEYGRGSARETSVWGGEAQRLHQGPAPPDRGHGPEELSAVSKQHHGWHPVPGTEQYSWQWQGCQCADRHQYAVSRVLPQNISQCLGRVREEEIGICELLTHCELGTKYLLYRNNFLNCSKPGHITIELQPNICIVFKHK